MSDAQNVNPAGGSDAGSGQPTADNTQAASSPISLNDDALVTYEGAKEPVKFGNLRGLQSQFTKVSQERAKLAENLSAREQRIQQLEGALRSLSGARGGGGVSQDPLADIRQLPYLSGEEAAGVIGNVIRAIQQRDAVMQLMAQRYGQLEQVVNQLHGVHAGSSFDQKISRFVSDLGLPAEFVEDARVFYLAHEPGPELDREFPELYRKHLEAQEARFRARERSKLEAGRKTLGSIPGKGGAGSAAGPLDFAGKSSQEVADMLWDALQASDGQNT